MKKIIIYFLFSFCPSKCMAQSELLDSLYNTFYTFKEFDDFFIYGKKNIPSKISNEKKSEFVDGLDEIHKTVKNELSNKFYKIFNSQFNAREIKKIEAFVKSKTFHELNFDDIEQNKLSTSDIENIKEEKIIIEELEKFSNSLSGKKLYAFLENCNTISEGKLNQQDFILKLKELFNNYGLK